MFKKISETQIYRDPDFYSAFPAIANLGGGELAVMFRRAPSSRGMPGLKPGWVTHLDHNSQAMIVRSHDYGKTWDKPKLLYAPPEGGSQDGGLFFDGKILFANSFIWGKVPAEVGAALKESGQDEYIYTYGGFSTHVGSYVLRSMDRGREWDGPFYPDPLPGYPDAWPGRPLRMHNRANIIRMPDGRLLYPGQALHYRPYRSSVVLYQSLDDGQSWQYLSTPAPDRNMAVFEEPALILTSTGKLVIIIRTHKSPSGEETRRARLWRTESTDGGLTWSEPADLGIHGEPATLARMEDGRNLLVYGYRCAPEGVRGRICNADLSDIPEAEEFIIRDDNGQPDCGYPWIAPMGDNKYLIVYYMDPPANLGSGGIYATLAEVK